MSAIRWSLRGKDEWVATAGGVEVCVFRGEDCWHAAIDQQVISRRGVRVRFGSKGSAGEHVVAIALARAAA